MIVPKGRASEHGALARYFADARCKVIVDRRVAERRRGHHEWVSRERRRDERRSGPLETSEPDALALYLVDSDGGTDDRNPARGLQL
jgi:hypothetical protein